MLEILVLSWERQQKYDRVKPIKEYIFYNFWHLQHILNYFWQFIHQRKKQKASGTGWSSDDQPSIISTS